MKNKINFGLKIFLAGVGIVSTINVIPRHISENEINQEKQMIIQQDMSELTLEKRKKQEEKRLHNKIKRDLEGEVLEVLANNLEHFPSATFDVLVEGWKKEILENANLEAGLEKSIKRAEGDIPSTKYEFLKKGVPLEYVFLGITESGWQNLTSKMKAKGVFQQMEKTAKDFGAIIDENYDERLNTLFAAEKTALILDDLHEKYKDWNIALAAYNSGGLPRRYLKEVEISKESHPSLIGYLMFLGRTIRNNPKNKKLLSYVDENLGFLKKNMGLFEILEANYPKIFNLEPRQDTSKIYEIQDTLFEYKIKPGDYLGKIAKIYVDEIYDINSKKATNRTLRWMLDDLKLNDKIHPGQKIYLPVPKTLREIEHQTGMNLRKNNPQVLNHRARLQNGAKIILY